MKQKKKYYDNIKALPLRNWWDIQDTNNFVYLQVDFDSEDLDQSEEALEAYQNINDQIIEKYGVSSAFLKVLKKKKKYLVLMNDALSSGDKYKEWKAKIVEKEINDLTSKESQGKREDSLVIIHKFVGGNIINPNEITVDQYYYYMDFVNRSLKEKKNSLIDG